MNRKRPKIIIYVLLIFVALISVFGVYEYIPRILADKSWISDLGYEEDEVHKLSFDRFGKRSCPQIPVSIGEDTYKFGFDTGCGSGIFFTNVIEDKIDFDFISETEALNRDGSHRGWEKQVSVNEISVLGDDYKNIKTSISDWSMFSSDKFNGTIGLAYFDSKIITLDYRGHKIAVSNNAIDYSKLDPDKYVVLPLYKTTSVDQQDLPFFEAEYNNKPIIVYLDTGKNYSYRLDTNCDRSMQDKPTDLFDTPLTIGSMELMLQDITTVNDIAQADGLPYQTMMELNSDQIWKCNLLITLDLIEQKIIIRKL